MTDSELYLGNIKSGLLHHDMNGNCLEHKYLDEAVRKANAFDEIRKHLLTKPREYLFSTEVDKTYDVMKRNLNRLKKLEYVFQILKQHTHLASGLCEIKLVDYEVSKITPKYHNGKEVYEPDYNEFYKLFLEVLENVD